MFFVGAANDLAKVWLNLREHRRGERNYTECRGSLSPGVQL